MENAMSEYDFEDQELDNTTEENNEPARDSRQFVRKLEQEAKEGKAAKRQAEDARNEADAAKRELALIKSGVDVESPTGKLFAKAYDGEISVEAIKAAATEYGLIATSQTSEVKSDLDALDRISQAAAGSTGAIAPTALDAIRNAADPSEVMKVLRENNIVISHDQPGQMFKI